MTSVLLPSTGELLTLDDINGRLIELSRTLDASSADLVAAVNELGAVTFRYDAVYQATIVTSEAKSEDKRKAAAWSACDADRWRFGESVALARSRMEIQVRVLRDGQHNMRAQMSALQSVASNLRAELSLGNVGGGT